MNFFSTVAWFMEYFAISFDFFGGFSDYLCSKDQRLLDWTQRQLVFSFHTLLPASNSSHISFLLPLYTQLQVWRSREIISTSTLLHPKIISVLGDAYLPLSSAWLCCGFQQCPCVSNAKLEQCAIVTWILDLWQPPMAISSFKWAPVDCSVSEMKLYSIISYFLSWYETEQFQKTWRANLHSEVYKN